MLGDDPRAIPFSGTDQPKRGLLGLDLRLESPTPAQVGASFSKADAKPLSQPETDELLARLPRRPDEAKAGFVLPPAGPPPPVAQKSEVSAFPPPGDGQEGPPEATPTGPLTVLRSAPEGEVAVARDVQVQLSEPMVPLSGLDVVDERTSATLEPTPEGKWRWVDPSTLVFEPTSGRLPAATDYTLTIPAGARSELGQTLAETYQARFSTPRPRVLNVYPAKGSADVRTRPVVVLVFNQAVDRDAVHALASLDVGGEPGPKLALATEADLGRDRPARSAYTAAGQDRSVALVPTEDLPKETEIRLLVRQGAWSQEGPRPSAAPFRSKFKTHGPLRIVGSECGWGDECRPGAPFRFRFSNRLAPVDEDAGAKVSIVPEPAGLEIRIDEGGVVISGRTRAMTAYTVKLSEDITDEHGQRLGPGEAVTFEVKGAYPFLQGLGPIVRRLEGSPEVPLYSAGAKSLAVETRSVEPSDWPAWQDSFRGRRNAPKLPGKLSFRGQVPVKAPPEHIAETRVDVGSTLNSAGHGLALVSVSAPVGRRGRDRSVYFWTVVSNVFLDAWSGEDTLYVAASEPDGAPISDLEVRLQPNGPSARTGEDGLARIPLPASPLGPHPWLETDLGGFLPEGSWSNGRDFARRSPPGPRVPILTVDDRGLYRPGETAHIKGWARRFDVERGLEAFPKGGEIAYEVRGPRGNEWAKGKLKLSQYGSFSVDLNIPEDANLGRAQVVLSVSGGDVSGRHVHSLRVEEFRRPRFDVTMAVEEPPHVVGRSLAAQITATAYAGGPLGGAVVRWSVTERRAQYEPPGWDNYRFGQSFPWWWGPISEVGGFGRGLGLPDGGGQVENRSGETDAAGQSRLVLEPRSLKTPFPVGLDIRAEVADVDRRRVATTKDALIHPSERYVGVKPAKTFLDEGEALAVNVVAVSIDGTATPGSPIVLTVHPHPGFGWSNQDPGEAVDTCEVTSGSDPTVCQLEAPDPGRYLLRAEVTDARGRPSRTEATVYWSGRPPASTETLTTEKLELAPDRQRYAPGEVAEVTVRSPLSEALGFWIAEADGILDIQPLTVAGGTATLRIPLTVRMVPGVTIETWVAGGSRDHPREAQGQVGLDVFPSQDILQVEVVPREPETSPGAETEVTVIVRNFDGKPAPGVEVTLAVVDEAVLAVSGSEWPEPLQSLLLARNQHARSWHTRSDLLIDSPTQTADVQEDAEGAEMAKMAAPAARGMMMMEVQASAAAPGGGGGEAPSVNLRSDFRPIAHYEPSAITGPDGKATIQFKLPDDLTRYRARAVAAAHTAQKLGRGEASFVARKPLSIEAGLPRFLSFGDRAELPFIISNRTDNPTAVLAAVDASGVEWVDPSGVTTVVPPRERVELRFTANVGEVGEAWVRGIVAALDGSAADAVEKRLPVYAPATTEAFAEHGSLTKGALARRLEVPKDVSEAVGGLTLEVSPTRLLAAQDAFRDVVRYPYLCAEQRASRLVALTAHAELLDVFEGDDVPAASELQSMAEEDLKRLLEQQRDDGGWGFWIRAQRSDAFLTAHVLHALIRARAAEPSMRVPDEAINRAVAYLERLPAGLPEWYGKSAVAAVTAHAQWVLSRIGRAQQKTIEAVLEIGGGPKAAGSETLAWLHGATRTLTGALSLREGLKKALANRISITAQTAHLVSAYDGGGHLVLHGEARADAIHLLGLLDLHEKDPLIEKLLSGLMAGRRASGSWSHTQENAWALLAVAAYAQAREKAAPRFTARMWLGSNLAFDQAFKARTEPAQKVVVPTEWLGAHPDARDIVLGHEGKGRLHYRLGLAYAPQDLRTAPASRGFTVRRHYQAVDDAGEVVKTDEGWRIRAGARVRVRLEVVAPGPRHHVALVDRLPAGLEPLHPALEKMEPLPPAEGERSSSERYLTWWWGWEHENLRDSGAEVFATDLPPGFRSYTYVARATTPGRYIAAPARAEEMYAPETFGRSAAEVVEVVDK